MTSIKIHTLKLTDDELETVHHALATWSTIAVVQSEALKARLLANDILEQIEQPTIGQMIALQDREDGLC